MLYAVAQDWMWQRHVLGLLGAIRNAVAGKRIDTDVAPLDTALDAAAAGWRSSHRATVHNLADRMAQVQAMGGEVSVSGG